MPQTTAHPLPPPPPYFPPRHGRYDVAPGLSKLKNLLGNQDDVDAKLFQLDNNFTDFQASKFAARARHLDTYYQTADLAEPIAANVAAFIAGRLATEHPALFRWSHADSGTTVLHAALTGEALTFNGRMQIISVHRSDDGIGPRPPYVDALDALASQIQEDLAILSIENGRHWLSAAHVCFPNGWAPAEKVGKSFAGLHEPVPGMEAMNQRGEHFADVMVNAVNGLVRFAWGITFDDRLDHHPARPRAPFDPAHPRAFLRVERQTIRGFPRHGAALFTIRTYLYDCERLRHDPATRGPLASALRSMSPASRRYKGIDDDFDDLVSWLEREE